MGNRCIDGAFQIQHIFDELTPEQHQTRGSQIMLQFSQQLSLSFVDWHNGTGIAYGRPRLQNPKLHPRRDRSSPDMHISPLLHVTIAELFHGLSTCQPARLPTCAQGFWSRITQIRDLQSQLIPVSDDEYCVLTRHGVGGSPTPAVYRDLRTTQIEERT
ncbi:hypothetical protein LA080_013128 [Diaporthe eres]|nr:hypothetical protein LA080_013128 [Diaporthe eres]